MMTSSEELTSISKVESNNELLIAILILLPLRLLNKLTVVSRRWKDIITSNYFRELWLRKENRFRLLAFIQTTPGLIQRQVFYKDYMNLLPVAEAGKKNLIPEALCHSMSVDFGFFISCSNLLILSGFHYKNLYFVVNIMTRKFRQLPQPPERIGLPSMALLHEIEKLSLVPTYKILSAPSGLLGNLLPLQIYSSDTCEWTRSILKGAENFMISAFERPTAMNGFIHWYSSSPWSLVILNINKDVIQHVSIGGDGELIQDNVQLIMLPDINITEPSNFSCTRASNDELWFGAIDGVIMRMWMLPKHKHGINHSTIGQSEWILMDTISLDTRLAVEIASGYFRIEALIPWKSSTFALVRFISKDKMFLYDLQQKSFEVLIYDIPVLYFRDSPTRPLCLYPYTLIPLTLSSCGPLDL